MSDDLIKTLDDAAAHMMEKVLAEGGFQDQLECFKLVAAWTERRAKLKPPETPKGGEKFKHLRSELHEPSGKSVRRGGGAKAQADAGTDSDGDPASRPDA